MKPSHLENQELIFCCSMSRNLFRRNKGVPHPIPEEKSHPCRVANRPLHGHDASTGEQLLYAQHQKWPGNMFVEDLTTTPELAHWNCVCEGKTIFSRSLQEVQNSANAAPLKGLKVGTSVDIRNGFDVMTSKGQHMVRENIKDKGLMSSSWYQCAVHGQTSEHPTSAGNNFITEQQTPKIWHLPCT